MVSSAHTANGTTLICGVVVAGLTGENRPLRGSSGPDRVTGVNLADGRHLPADVVVVGIGGIPNIEWLRDSGLALGNGVICGADGETTIPGVVAVGDCADWHDDLTARHHRVEHWTGARERPAVAVATLLAGGLRPGRPGHAVLLVGPVRREDPVRRATRGRPTAHRRGRRSDDRSFLAVYRRAGPPVAVLGMNQPRLFSAGAASLAAARPPMRLHRRSIKHRPESLFPARE